MSKRKKSCSSFKQEWLSEIVDVVMPCSLQPQKVTIRDIYDVNENSEVICNICMKAKSNSEFAKGKTWNDDWKLDYLKRHLRHKNHLDSVVTLRDQSQNVIQRLFNETSSSREMRLELTERKKSKPEMVKVLINNVILGIKINCSMLSIQDIHEHMSKYIQIPEAWRSKNYAFEFVDCINYVVQKQYINEIYDSPFHSLIVDESTDISVQKMLILYFKYRTKLPNICYKTVFGGIIHITSCDSQSIVVAIKRFYSVHGIDLQKMVLFVSDGASVMLGKNNGVAAILRREISHLSEQHCVAHRENLGIEDAWKQIPLIRDVEILLTTIYSIFSRSTVKRDMFEQLAAVADADVIAFRPLNQVRWLSKHFAVTAVIRNYDILVKYCKDEMEEKNDPICKYCWKKLSQSKFRVVLNILNDVMSELASMTNYFQRSGLTTIDAMQFAKAKINKLKAQYLGEKVFWSQNVQNIFDNLKENEIVSTTEILTFIEKLCDHLQQRFPEDEIKDFIVFDMSAIVNNKSFNFGNDRIKQLIKKYLHLLPNNIEDIELKILEQFSNFKFIVANKAADGSLHTFADMVKLILSDSDFSEMNILLDIFATFEASSVECERGFSLMNNIKTKSRNRLEVDHLDKLMRIKAHLSKGNEICLDSAYTQWVNNKDRREK